MAAELQEPDCMVEEEERFHGLHPLKRFKILEKERVMQKREEEEGVTKRENPNLRQVENEVGVKVCSLPAKKRVCALQFFTSLSDEEDEQENRMMLTKMKREAGSVAARALQPINSNCKVPVFVKKEKEEKKQKGAIMSSRIRAANLPPVSNGQVTVPTDSTEKASLRQQQQNGVKPAQWKVPVTTAEGRGRERLHDCQESVGTGLPEKCVAGKPEKRCLADEQEEQLDGEDDGVFCDVCKDADADPSDPIVFCDGCNVMVHPSCYGNPLNDGIPTGDWFCRQCESENRRKKAGESHKGSHVGFHAGQRTSVSRVCCLCPSRTGAMKRTTGGAWAHLSCALYVPEVFYKRARDREGIECRSVPAWRWELPCVVCETRGQGACIQCTEVGCRSTFHVSCALNAGLTIDFRNANMLTKTPAIVIAFCPSHSRQALTSSERRRFKIVPRT